MAKRIASVVGYYGMSNYGDDLFGDVIAENSALLLPGFDVKIVRGLSDSQTSPDSRMTRLTRFYASNSAVGSLLRLGAGVAALFRSRSIVLGGGSVLSTVAGVRKIQMKLAPLSRTTFQALGVSLGPFKDSHSQQKVSEFVNTFERVVVRDNASLDFGRSFGLTNQLSMGGDLAALYRPNDSYPVEKPAEVRRVGVAVCPFPGFGSAEAEEMAREMVDALQETRIPSRRDVVALLSLNNHPLHGDDALSAAMARVFRSNGIEVEMHAHSALGVSGIWACISQLDVMVAVRLHAAITAYLTGVPFVLLEYQQKCSDFLTDIGQDEHLRLSRTQTTPRSPSFIEVLSVPNQPQFPRQSYVKRARGSYFNE